MSISDQEYADWLADLSSPRCVLVELDYPSSSTRYVSNMGYVSTSSDSPENTHYEDILSKSPELYQSIDGDAVVGDFEIHNDGSLDSW